MVTISQEIALLSVGKKECLHVANHDAEWVVDTTTSYHATPNRDFLMTYKARDFGTVKMDNTSCAQIMGIKNMQIKTKVRCTMVLKDF